jgi:N-acetylglucosaminyl-diphospho-decaprenol L-rhamnosyltransferase
MITACVILNYNDSESTIRLINSIKDYEELDFLIVVDNKSTDDSFETLSKYSNEKIKVLTTNRNGGYGYGNNYGIKYAYNNLNATHILISNPDVEFSNRCVRAMKTAFIEHDECSIVAPAVYNKGKVVAWKIPSLFWDIGYATFVFRKLFKSKKEYPKNYFNNKKSCYVDVVSGSLLMVDAKVMMEYGMYDEEMFLYNEEKVLATKMKKSGYKSLLLLNESFIHHHSVSVRKSIKSSVKLKKIGNESELIYLKKYRNLRGVRLVLTKLYFKYALAEMFIISLLRKG